MHLDATLRRLGAVARHPCGAKELTARIYGVGPVTGVALPRWLGGARRFTSSRKAFAGLDVRSWRTAHRG